MAKNKTLETRQSVARFISKIPGVKKREDFLTIIDLMTKQTGLEPKLWGTSIVGFGMYHYTYESGREGESPRIEILCFRNTEEINSSFSRLAGLLRGNQHPQSVARRPTHRRQSVRDPG